MSGGRMWPESSAAGDDGGCGGMTVIGGGEADVVGEQRRKYKTIPCAKYVK